MAWDYPSNFTFGNETLAVDSVGNLFRYGYDITGGIFGYGVVIAIFLMVLLGGMAVNSRKAIGAACFVSTIFAAYFMMLGMFSQALVGLLVLLTAATMGLGAKEGGANF